VVEEEESDTDEESRTQVKRKVVTIPHKGPQNGPQQASQKGKGKAPISFDAFLHVQKPQGVKKNKKKKKKGGVVPVLGK
jgi:hypothetical protein